MSNQVEMHKWIIIKPWDYGSIPGYLNCVIYHPDNGFKIAYYSYRADGWCFSDQFGDKIDYQPTHYMLLKNPDNRTCNDRRKGDRRKGVL